MNPTVDTESETSAPAGGVTHRATILVGYGSFGRDVLRRLLASTAPRGVLRWQEPHGGATSSERHLRNLVLLWVKDRWEPDFVTLDEESEGSGFEMMRDLYRQIEEVREESRLEDDFAAAVSRAADQLLDASSRAGRRDTDPLGLDVVLLARPGDREVVGFLDRLLTRGMQRLANYSNLIRPVQGAEILNFIAIFEFENYWDLSERGRRIRQAIHRSVEDWERRRRQRQPAFGRFYLVDGLTRDGRRDPRLRIEEISLFLELLLFEGQRGGPFQRLYQSGGMHEAPIATFGIRLMERSAGLLSRLAAARFGRDWLDYLAEREPLHPDPEPQELRRRLEPYRVARLQSLIGGDQLRKRLREQITALEAELLELAPDDPAWPERVRDCWRQRAEEIENELAEAAGNRMVEISQHELAALGQDLRDGIDADLHNPRHPVPLGVVLAEIERARRELQTGQERRASLGDPEASLREIRRFHRSFRDFSTRLIHLDELRQKGWPFLALILTAGAAPFAVQQLKDVIDRLPKPDPTSYWLPKLYTLLGWASTPAAVTVALFFLFWLVGRAMQSRVASRVERSRRFYTDDERGRFADRLRRDLSAGGALAAPLEDALERQLYNMELSIRSEVSRELGKVADYLGQRLEEMRWLRKQLHDFLVLHGADGDPSQENKRLGHDETGIRRSVARFDDFERMLKSNPPHPERFRSTQATQRPFRNWHRRYSDAFLYPFSFIERMSHVYKDPFLEELSQPGTGPEQRSRARELLEFLQQQGTFDLAFSWKAQEGVPTDRRYCLLPEVWRQLPGVMPALNDLRMPGENVFIGSDVARAYLLRIQTGIEVDCLLEAAP